MCDVTVMTLYHILMILYHLLMILYHSDLSSRVPLQYCIVGKPEGDSRVVDGVITDLHSDMLNLSQSMAARNSLLKVLVSVKIGQFVGTYLSGSCSMT